DLPEINKVLDKTDLDMVQLCGEKDFDISTPSIRQIRIKESDNPNQILEYVQRALLSHNYVVLDSYHEKKLGGTGNKFDWNKAKNVIGLTNVLVSGGLNTENIKSLLKNFSPYGIDTSSGVETNGIKDLKKIKRFIELAKN
ncbi:MAG: phosphoribosylanthranilate isomerase, partial [Dehalococcoidia bacterium]